MIQMTKSPHSTDVECNLDQDETEWTSPSSYNYSKKFGEHEASPSYAGADLHDQHHENEKMVMGEFRGADAHGASFAFAELSFADFTRADLRGADFHSADLCKANFRGANLAGADFHDSDLVQAILIGANLKGAKFKGADLDSADLHGARYDKFTELPFPDDEANRRGMHNESEERI